MNSIKLLKKIKPSKIGLALIILAILVVTEIFVIKKGVNYNPTKKVVVATQTLKKGTQIQEGMLQYKEFNITNIPSNAVEDIEDVENKYTDREVDPGQFITSSILKETNTQYQLKPNEALVTVKFEPDKANVYLYDKGQKVKLAFIPKNNDENKLYEYKVMDVVIKEIMDSGLNKVGTPEYSKSSATYVTFATEKANAEYILKVKDQGRLEIYNTEHK